MFDQNTIKLMYSAPDFKQIDLKSLSKEFTKVYAEILTSRTKLQREAGSEETRDLINRLKKIALTYEGILAVNSERTLTELKSIAFIAASAHHLVFLAQQKISDSSINSKLTTHMISSDISAALLFVISGYMLDAKNMANLISVSSDNSNIKAFLLRSIVALIYGDLESILIYDLDDLYMDDSDQLVEQATNALYLMLSQGIQVLAKELLAQAEDSSYEYFQRVHDMCSETLALENNKYMSIYAGPRYLATLLKLVSKSLISKATVKVDKQLDKEFLIRVAENTPYLSENDISVLNTEYLNHDVSSVIRHAIGMDYYSILSLKIIATLTFSQQKTLLLVEDRYSLYKATSRLKDIFGDQVQTYKDFDQFKTNIVLIVTVQDLIELLKKTDFIQLNLGLFVIEECAILGNSFNVTDASIEPMFALLSFLDKFPTITMLVFTSKVQNIQEVSEWIENITNNFCLPILLESKPARQAKGIVVYNATELEENDAQDVHPLGLFSLEQNWVNQVSEKSYSLVKLSDALVSLSLGSCGRLAPNKYNVSTLIAESLALPDCKVVVFTDNVSSSVSHLTNKTKKEVYLNDEETRLYSQCLNEFGGAEELYLQVDEQGSIVSSGMCDFHLLLPIERRLYRSLFQRQDGVDLLITNIWSSSFKDLSYNVAVIVGHQQFDLESERQIPYNKQELLEQIHHIGINSPSSSNGLAIIVPSNVIQIQSKNIPAEIMAIYSSDEYGSELYDPLTNILDSLTVHQSIDEAELPLVRLICSETKDLNNERLIKSIVNNSYGSYKKDDIKWKKTRVDQLLSRQIEYENFSPYDCFADDLGIRSSLLYKISDVLHDIPDNVIEIHHFISDLVLKDCLELKEYFKHLLSKALHREKKNIPKPSDIISFISFWIRGDSIIDISKKIKKAPRSHNQKLLWYRRILCGCIPVYTAIIDLVKHIYQKCIGKELLSLNLLSDCIKYGFDRYEKLILYRILEEKENRRRVHDIFNKLDIAQHARLTHESYTEALERVNASYNKMIE